VLAEQEGGRGLPKLQEGADEDSGVVRTRNWSDLWHYFDTIIL